MPRDSNGNATRKSPPGAGGYVSGDVISPSQVNGEINDIYIELTNSIDKSGRTKPTANLPMNGKRHTGCGSAVNTTDYCTYGQAQTLANAVIPSGAEMPFYQANPPTGWTTVGITNNSMMRIVTAGTSGGTGGGTDSPIVMDKVPSHTHSASSGVTDPGHTHAGVPLKLVNVDRGTGNSLFSLDDEGSTSPAATGITVSTTIGANGSAVNWYPKYADFCIGIKS